MSHGVLIPQSIAALNVDAYNRSAICATALDNGNAVILSAKSTTSQEGEVYTAVAPNTGSVLTGLWMVYEPEIVLTTSGNSIYKGLDPDPRNFFIPASTASARYVFSVFKPQLGDILLATADCFYGSVGANTYVNAGATGTWELEWGSSQTGSVLSMHVIGTSYISIATGSIDTQRVTAYQFEVVGL
jgi:hypothetical protein